jgi:hypothetical protein
LLVGYLDFPYLFYGRKCCNMNGIGHFFFTPVTGVWFPNLRRLFFFFFGVVYVANLACIFLTLMWIALGVVVNPALAIPYATGIVVFFTNLNNVKNSLLNWQQLVVDEVLERLMPFLTSQLAIKDTLTNIKGMVETVLEEMEKAVDTAADMKPLLTVLTMLKKNLSNDANGITFRKLKESEISVLLRSLWFSIREELGLSNRNIFIAVISSSLILGLLLLFIFIGVCDMHSYIHAHVEISNRNFGLLKIATLTIHLSGVSVFAQTDDPFASVINSLLTVGAGIGLWLNSVASIHSC